MRLSLAHNIADLERDLSDVAREQLPYAVSLALNETAAEVASEAIELLSQKLDRPTPFTLRAFRVRPSSKRNLVAVVEARPIQAEYLARLEDGGTDLPEGRAIVTPQAARLNAFGNMPRGSVRRAAASRNVFSGQPSGQPSRGPGLYRRMGRGKQKRLVKIVSYLDAVTYRPILGLGALVRLTVDRHFPAALGRALSRALASRR